MVGIEDWFLWLGTSWEGLGAGGVAESSPSKPLLPCHSTGQTSSSGGTLPALTT